MSEPLRLPHLRSSLLQPIVCLTSVTHEQRETLATADAFRILTSIWQLSSEFDGWYVGDYLLMPDHVHLFARAGFEAKPLAQWIETWKSLSARRLKPLLGIETSFWQQDSFDRFLRSADNYSMEWDYVNMNPVRRGLCGRPEDWPWKGRLCDLKY